MKNSIAAEAVGYLRSNFIGFSIIMSVLMLFAVILIGGWREGKRNQETKEKNFLECFGVPLPRSDQARANAQPAVIKVLILEKDRMDAIQSKLDENKKALDEARTHVRVDNFTQFIKFKNDQEQQAALDRVALKEQTDTFNKICAMAYDAGFTDETTALGYSRSCGC